MDGVVSRGVPRARVERALQRLLPLYFWIVGWATVAIGYLYGQNHSPVAVGAWLVNYRAGWVRRGLPGEVLWHIAAWLRLNPGILLWLFWSLLWGLVLALLFQALRAQPALWPWAFLVFAPYTAAYPLNLAYEEFLRKEALYTLLLLALVAAGLRCAKPCFARLALGVLLAFPLLVLAHEALFLYLPYLLVVYHRRLGWAARGKVAFAVALASLAFGTAVLSGPMSAAQVARLRQSWAALGYPLTSGGYMTPLDALQHTPAEAHAFLRTVWQQWHMGFWCTLAFPLSLAAFWPVRHRLRYLAQDRWVRWLVGLSLVGTVVLFTVAVDWGRFLRIHLMSWFALALSVPTREGEPWPQEVTAKPVPVWQLALLAFYALGWRLGFQCKIFPSFFIQLTWPLWHH